LRDKQKDKEKKGAMAHYQLVDTLPNALFTKMPLIWRLQFHKILLNSNNGIVFGQDNGILANTKFGAIKKTPKQ
jgi:hypothetical protein